MAAKDFLPVILPMTRIGPALFMKATKFATATDAHVVHVPRTLLDRYNTRSTAIRAALELASQQTATPLLSKRSLGWGTLTGTFGPKKSICARMVI
jgi:hypothetical protein